MYFKRYLPIKHSLLNFSELYQPEKQVFLNKNYSDYLSFPALTPDLSLLASLALTITLSSYPKFPPT